MAANVYEGMFILDSGRYSRDAGGVSGEIAKIVADTGGEMLVSRLWEERRLAYPINGQRKGTYWLAYFRLESTRLSEINRKCQLSENIMRFLLLKVDPRIVDTLVEHARTGQYVSRAAPAAPAETDSAPVADIAEIEG
ncbi:MAG: 30S ribosomal protein S6 [Thermoguttaceae bacterium]|nr:30S ribosomal protein S6 [Thermoguttaceae bacterium]